MEMVVPVMRRHAIAAVADAATVEGGSGAKTATMDRDTPASESTAMKRRAAAMKTAAATKAATTVEATTMATATMATATMTAATATATPANLGRQPVSERFRRRRRAGTGE